MTSRFRRIVQRSFKVVLDVIEVHLPTLVFFVLFSAFIIQIFNRYFLRPLTWPEELALIGFIWTALLGALYAKRDDRHVVFTVIYDSVSPTTQRWMRIIGNLLLVVAFAMAFLPVVEYVSFMSYKRSNVLRIPMNIAYFPFIVFLIVMTGRLVVDLVRDIRQVLKDLKSKGDSIR